MAGERKLALSESVEIRRHSFPGFYVVFEGVGGTGKDICSKRIAERITGLLPNRKVIWVHEPGSTPEAERLRQILKTQKLLPEQEVEYFAQARGSLLLGVVEPILRYGGVVVSGRNYVSSLAYQAFGRNLGLDRVIERNRPFIERFTPDCYIYRERDLELALSQTVEEYRQKDRFDLEGIDFNRRVLEGYRAVRDLFSHASNWVSVDSEDESDDLWAVTEKAWNKLLPLLNNWHEGKRP